AHAGGKPPVGFFGQCTGADRVRPGVVADVGGGRLAGQRSHGGPHAAGILEVVVGVGDVVLAGVGVLGSDSDAPVLTVHIVGGCPAIEAAPVRESAPPRVHLRQVGI